MDVESLLSQVDIERLYKHILSLHYERDPVFSPDLLLKARDYVTKELQTYGVTTSTHSFKIPGSDVVYDNVVGQLGSGEPEMLITSHYDHVRDVPGADDNLSAVAVMLEVARILAEAGVDKRIGFVSFNLEEQNPVLSRSLHEKGVQLGLWGEDGIPLLYHTAKLLKVYQKSLSHYRNSKLSYEISCEKAFDAHKGSMNAEEAEYFSYMVERTKDVQSRNPAGFFGINGSAHYVESLREKGHQVKGMINLETIGFSSDKPNSQVFPEKLNIHQFPSYKVEDITTGDFIVICSDNNSLELGQSFFKACQHPAVELPAVFLAIPFGFEEIKTEIPDLLRADHAPFWKAQIPALMITDSADFRNPYYHTPGDRIETLDFEFMRKITQASLLSSLS